jgi:5-formyltetrahydrofolate cyclo-ligase
MTKDKLRKLFLAKRHHLNPELLQEKSQAISQVFFHYFDLNEIKKIHLFLPILKHNEINTWFIIQTLFQNYAHIHPIVSKSHLKTYRMESYVLERMTEMVENRWGIPEPVNAIPCPDEDIDMIIMPLLCFDKQGFRVGYGKGFYDRYLRQCRSNLIKIGLSLFEPVDNIEDVNNYDIKMDFCVMSDNVFNFQL